MTKKTHAYLSNYKRATATELWEVYGTYSAAKASALEYCKRDMADRNGFGGRICSANTHQFTYAFMYPDADTGVLRLRYHTAANVYDFEIEEAV